MFQSYLVMTGVFLGLGVLCRWRYPHCSLEYLLQRITQMIEPGPRQQPRECRQPS